MAMSEHESYSCPQCELSKLQKSKRLAVLEKAKRFDQKSATLVVTCLEIARPGQRRKI